MTNIYPSLTAGKSLIDLKQDIALLEPYCAGFHLDVMDHKFVPNDAFSSNEINQIRQYCNKQLFVHLMVKNSIEWLNTLKLRNNDICAFHIESCQNPTELIEIIHSYGLLAALTINPKTPIEIAFNFTRLVDHILIMSVEPGKSGQEFIPETIGKIKKLVQFKKSNNLKFELSIDGGINENNIAELKAMGVNNFAISSAIFKGDPLNNLKRLNSLIGQ